MISVSQADQFFKQHLKLHKAALAETIVADRDYPPFDRVMMDGIAVNYEHFLTGSVRFPIEGIQAAGESAKKLHSPEACLEVMTGAPLPIGTDLVIPYEHLELSQGVAILLKIMDRSRMENVHLKGSDCRQGETVLLRGEPLNGPHMGIASSMGCDFHLSPSSKILIVSTGDELVEVHEKPLGHQIRRSNVHALKASLNLNDFYDITLDHLKDDAQAVADHYQKNARHFDVMIYSGGVSKGKFDYLPLVWREQGVEKHFHEVAQRPGKPLWFGMDHKNKTTVIGLPGNPVSSLVCLHRYIIPGREIYVKLSEEVIFKKDLTYFLPAKMESKTDGSLWATPLKLKNSGEFTALAGSDGFIELPAEKSLFEAGGVYAFWPWRNI